MRATRARDHMNRDSDRGWRRLSGWLVVAVAACGLATALAGPATPPVAVINIRGMIDVPTAEYLNHGLEIARQRNAQCLVVTLDTPGGMGQPMIDMTEALLNSTIPTVVFVYPAGAWAMSAGTFITLATNVAAMNPDTNIGAAHPVGLFGGAPAPPHDPETQKILNAFAGRIGVIAKERGRDVAWAQQAVRSSATLSASDAVKMHVVNFLASDMPDLLAKLDGRVVTVAGNRKVVLHTVGAPLLLVPPSLKDQFLHLLSDPNMLLVLMVLAGMGLLFEFLHPGAIFPGIVGVICLLLTLYSMAVIPVRPAGVGLIVFALLLFAADVKLASHGVLTVGGIASFILGALMLTGGVASRGLQPAWVVILTLVGMLVLFFGFLVRAVYRARKRKVQTGEEAMLGEKGRALTALNPNGEISLEGELWKARSLEGDIAAGEQIEVAGEDGLTLLVRRSGDHRSEAAQA
jgi:membrane-bound serine protease (ClpP class)